MVYPALLPLMPHTSAASSQLNWRPAPTARFKWPRPFRTKDEIWFLRVWRHSSTGLSHEWPVNDVQMTTDLYCGILKEGFSSWYSVGKLGGDADWASDEYGRTLNTNKLWLIFTQQPAHSGNLTVHSAIKFSCSLTCFQLRNWRHNVICTFMGLYCRTYRTVLWVSGFDGVWRRLLTGSHEHLLRWDWPLQFAAFDELTHVAVGTPTLTLQRGGI